MAEGDTASTAATGLETAGSSEGLGEFSLLMRAGIWVRRASLLPLSLVNLGQPLSTVE